WPRDWSSDVCSSDLERRRARCQRGTGPDNSSHCLSNRLTHVTLDGRRSEHRRSHGVQKTSTQRDPCQSRIALRVATSELRWCCKIGRASCRERSDTG